ncbi:hypothetical protein ACLMJK_007353 [Lecanora helva]
MTLNASSKSAKKALQVNLTYLRVMEAFLCRSKTNQSSSSTNSIPHLNQDGGSIDDDASTDIKLATLASLFPNIEQATLLDFLISENGSVDAVTQSLSFSKEKSSPQKRPASIGHQSSLAFFRKPESNASDPPPTKRRALTRKGQTLHLYSPEDIAAHTPCSITHNFLPPEEANELLKELLQEAPTFERQTFKLFDNVVQSPHSACFYVNSSNDQEEQKTKYLYNGSYLSDVRQITAQMRAVSSKVETAVNDEIANRIRNHYPNGKKLKHQSPSRWIPNAAFVNCYKGGVENVGYHSDQLTYLGPRAVIGSLSLGVAREFRVRKIVARDDNEDSSSIIPNNTTQDKSRVSNSAAKASLRADAEGQISIHLPHNSLLVMHAEMQEEWKHSIAPAKVIDPHPIAGDRRINITYRYYREAFHPKFTPKCWCGVACVLKCVQRRRENRGRYMWMCHVGNTPGKEGCSFFQWAEFDDDGDPPWMKKEISNQPID